MPCFYPEDAIFVLNKWDAIPDENQRDAFFENTNKQIHAIWKDVDDRHILKLSAAKVLNICLDELLVSPFQMFLFLSNLDICC